MSMNHCSEIITLLQYSITNSNNLTYYNKKLLELGNCNDYNDLLSKLEKQHIKIKTNPILPKTEIGINFNPETKTLLIFPTNNFRVSDK